MMRSGDRSGMLDLERDLPTTTEDVDALRRARAMHPLDLNAYLRFLASLPPSPAPNLSRRQVPAEIGRSHRPTEAWPGFSSRPRSHLAADP